MGLPASWCALAMRRHWLPRWVGADGSACCNILHSSIWRVRTSLITTNYYLDGRFMRSLLGTLENFRSVHLLVVGDLMLDRFIWGEVERLSPEAPVPVLRVVSEDSSLGGAANVVQNIRALGGRVTACGIIGRDDAGRRIVNALQKVGASTAGV